MRPDPRVDSILRWRYAIIAKDLRASAQHTADQRKADDLRMMADYYDCLAATSEVGPAPASVPGSGRRGFWGRPKLIERVASNSTDLEAPQS
jgi:hypothetical protein